MPADTQVPMPVSSVFMPVLFSDLDGTCIHYQESMGRATVAAACDDAGLWDCVCGETGQRTRLLRLPPSTSGAAGVVSLRTLERYAALRALGVKLVLISGARSSTLLQRLPWLPAADAYVCESGGRVFYPGAPAPTAAPLTEDLAWRRQLAEATGPLGQDALPPLQRSGLLWQHYARLASAPGLSLDAASYSTAFRVKACPERLAALPGDLPPGLASAINLGAADIFPAGSGKDAAARYLLARWGHDPGDCAFMCGVCGAGECCLPSCTLRPLLLLLRLLLLLLLRRLLLLLLLLLHPA